MTEWPKIDVDTKVPDLDSVKRAGVLAAAEDFWRRTRKLKGWTVSDPKGAQYGVTITVPGCERVDLRPSFEAAAIEGYSFVGPRKHEPLPLPWWHVEFDVPFVTVRRVAIGFFVLGAINGALLARLFLGLLFR